MIAIDMPMPNNCCDCPVNDHDAWCGITLTEFADDFCKIRLPDCPLIDITDDGKQASYFEVVTKYYEVGGMPERKQPPE